MKMDPGTALAVVSLAIQLAGTVQTINEFLRTIRDAPSELVALIETMDLMQSNLSQVHYLIEQQFSDPSLAGSPVFILNALKLCERRVGVQKAWVEEIQTSLKSRRLMKRTWANLNIRPKKTQIGEMQGEMREAMANLHFAVTNNQWQIQLQQVQMITTSRQLQMTNRNGDCRPVLVSVDELSITPRSRFEGAVASATSSSALHITSKEQTMLWYRGIFGVVATREKSINTRRIGSHTNGKTVSSHKVLTMTFPFLRRAVEVYFDTTFASVPRALRMYQMVKEGAPIFDMCENGDLDGIQNKFANGTISPFVVDETGWTLLHSAALCIEPEVCALLLRLGVDPDRGDKFGDKALIYSKYSGNDVTIDTIRTLTEAQDEVSNVDLVSLMLWRDVKPEAVEYILSSELVQDNIVHAGGEGHLFSALGAALRSYGAHVASDSVSWECPAQAFPATWESIIRKLLHIGVDIHAPVPREGYFQSGEFEFYPCTVSTYGTPLDELFTYTRTAGEAQDAANAWLQILATEGVDVSAYLEKEAALHAIRPMFTYPQDGYDYPPRQLVFNLGEAPTVYADWWIDPECSTHLVRQEFKDTFIFTGYDIFMWDGWWGFEKSRWKSVWPMSYPRWSDFLEPYMYHEEDWATWERLSARAQERADRRWQKKARRAAQRNGTRVHSSMPGAWPK